MPDEVNAAEYSVAPPTQEGTDDNDNNNAVEGEPEQGATQTDREPAGVEGLPEDWTPETLKANHKSYTDLQSEFTKRNEASKALDERFSPYGGADKLIESAQYLSNNPRFQEFVKAEQERSIYGENQEITDENREALEIVKKLVNDQVSQIVRDRVVPLENSRKEKALESNFEDMDKQYGNEWREQQESMTKLAESLPEHIQDNPGFADIEDLYWNSLRRDGGDKFNAALARTYQKKLESTKMKSIEKPGSVPAGRLGLKISNMSDAYNAAKETG